MWCVCLYKTNVSGGSSDGGSGDGVIPLQLTAVTAGTYIIYTHYTVIAFQQFDIATS